MKDRDSASPNGAPANVRDLRKALKAKRDELIRNHFRPEEFAAGIESGSTDQAASGRERNLAVERLSRNDFILHQVWDALDRLAFLLLGDAGWSDLGTPKRVLATVARTGVSRAWYVPPEFREKLV